MAQPTQERLVSQLEHPQKTSGNVGQAGSGTEPENSPHYQDHDDDHTHHVSMKTYYIIFALLMVLLFITVGAWYFDQHVRPLGALSTPIAMAIAVAKAVAIVLFFMHVKFASKLVQIFSCTGIAFVAIMFLLTFNDYGTRPWLPMAGVYTPSTAQNSMGNNGQGSGLIIRAANVGSSPMSQSTPADNMVGSAANAPGNATQTGIDAGRDRGARTANPGVMGADVQVVPNTTGATTTGASNMGAAMNSGQSATSMGSTMSSQSGQSAANPGGESMTTGGEQAGATGAAGMASGRQDTATNGSASRPGPIIGGAANNVYGSDVQSNGIEARRSAPAIKVMPGAKPMTNGTGATKPATAAKPATAPKPATAAQPATATR